MNPAGALTTLGAFDGANGYESFGCLVQGANGSLYGTTYGGGSEGYGTVFDVTTSGSLATLGSFGYSNGAYPTDGLALGSDGNFYGTTTGGGSSGCGSIFEMSLTGSLTTLFSFDFGDGYSPTAGLVQGSDGTFYGTTEEGGSYGEGTVFNITTSGSLTTLVNFSGANGDEPVGELAQGIDGSFYGTTYYGGAANDGTVFMMTTSGSLTTLCSFTGGNGANPIAGLVQGSDGNFYGTTYDGGAGGVGTVFMVTTSGSLTTLYTFNGLNGANPQAGLIQTSGGSIYGTTYAGGAYGYGTVFSLVPFGVTATLGMPFSYQVTTASNAPPTYSATNLPTGLSINAATGLISGTPTALGTSSVNMSASNAGGAGNATLTIAVVSGVPVITSTLSATGSSGAAFRYQIAATERPTSYGASGLPAGLSVNTVTGLISGSTTVSGTTFATLSAINASGTGSANLSIYIVPPAPVFPVYASVTGTVGLPFNYQIIASNNPTSYGATGLLAGLGLNDSTGVISGTPISTGSTRVMVSASNAGGTGTGTLIMVMVSGLPVINSASSAVGTTGLSFSYQITATNNPTSYGASGLPPGLSVSTVTGLVSGTATSSGTSAATISAINASGTGSAALTITMNSTAPVITSTSSAMATLGQAFSYRITATNNPTSFGASALPGGLSVNTSSGFITGTATATGTSAATIDAINASGTGSAILTIKVIQGAPVINSSLGVRGTVGSQFVYDITATNNPTSFSASGLPAGLSVSNATGVISGTATASGTTSSTIRAINASGTGSATLVITMAPPAPVITSTLSATGTSGVLFTYQITAANNPTSFQAAALPAGLGVNKSTGLISGTATSSGTTDAFIYAVSASGSGFATLVIDMLPPPPVITSALSATGTLGTLFSYQIVATNGPMSGYSASGLPPGLSVNTATGLISGSAASSGTSSATIGAYSVSGSASASLAITIRVSFVAWQNLWFTSAQLGDSAISSDTATPAGDGIPNLLKYAFNLNPLANCVNAMPVESVMTAGGTNYLTLTYTQDIFASDVTYMPEVSVDMQNWSSGALYFSPVSVTPNADGVTETVIVQDLAPMGASPQFLRLMVTGP